MSGFSSTSFDDEELFSTDMSETQLVTDLSSDSEGFSTDVSDTRRKRRRAGDGWFTLTPEQFVPVPDGALLHIHGQFVPAAVPPCLRQ